MKPKRSIDAIEAQMEGITEDRGVYGSLPDIDQNAQSKGSHQPIFITNNYNQNPFQFVWNNFEMDFMLKFFLLTVGIGFMFMMAILASLVL